MNLLISLSILVNRAIAALAWLDSARLRCQRRGGMISDFSRYDMTHDQLYKGQIAFKIWWNVANLPVQLSWADGRMWTHIALSNESEYLQQLGLLYNSIQLFLFQFKWSFSSHQAGFGKYSWVCLNIITVLAIESATPEKVSETYVSSSFLVAHWFHNALTFAINLINQFYCTENRYKSVLTSLIYRMF